MGEWKGVLERSDTHVDVTDTVEQYAKGKTFDCQCGLSHGVEYDVEATNCPRCGKTCVDRKSGDREPPETEASQMSLGDFS